MKLIVNSKYLSNQVKQALSWGCTNLASDGDKIIFSNATHSVEIGCHVKEDSHDDVSFDVVLWYRVMRLCKRIPEQPITVTIYDESVEVWCEHVFKNEPPQ